MSSKLKKGETVEIDGKKYKVQVCDGAYRRCRVCQEHNGICPCINPNPTVDNQLEWSQQRCVNTIPPNCYLKPCGDQDK